MKRLALVAVLASLIVPAFGQVNAKLEKELQADYSRMIAAMKKKDVSGMLNMMTEDATMKEGGQTITRKEFEQKLKRDIQMLDLQSSELKFSKAVAKGDLATTEYSEKMKAKIKTQDGKVSLFESDAKYKTTFKKVGGHWKMKDSETVGNPALKLNGKPFQMPGAPK